MKNNKQQTSDRIVLIQWNVNYSIARLSNEKSPGEFDFSKIKSLGAFQRSEAFLFY